MAEFEEVVRQFRRMCETQGCDGCPMYPACNIGQCRKIAFQRPNEFEAKVMKWAQEHPEPIYPTWGEWFVSEGLLPDEWDSLTSAYVYCVQNLLQSPISADSAQKLGIKPEIERHE